VVSRVANEQAQPARERLIGSWRYVGSNIDGRPRTGRGRDPKGIIIYDAHGNMAVQFSSPDRKPFAAGIADKGTPEERIEAFNTFRAYFGTYHYDEAAQTVTHVVVQGSDPNYSGTNQVRRYTFTDDLLTLETPARTFGARVGYGHLEWRRAG
jgi:hypothetical protein